MAVTWLAGVGFLRLHAAMFAVAGAVLLLIDLILDPSDLWALEVLEIWLVVLGSHSAALVAGWSTWRAIRPGRIADSPLAWFLPDADEPDNAMETLAPGPPQPLPATGRFSPGRHATPADADEAPTGIAAVLAAIGDAALDLADLGRSGLDKTRQGIARGIDWIRNEDDDDDDEYEDEEDGPPSPAGLDRPDLQNPQEASGR